MTAKKAIPCKNIEERKNIVDLVVTFVTFFTLFFPSSSGHRRDGNSKQAEDSS